MGIIEFFITCLVIVVLAYLCVWAMATFAPGHPAMVDNLIWGIAVLVILVILVQATGLLGHDPQIPRLR